MRELTPRTAAAFSSAEMFVQHPYNSVSKTVQQLYNICVHSAQKACKTARNLLQNNRR